MVSIPGGCNSDEQIASCYERSCCLSCDNHAAREARYANSNGVNIAYQVVGDGPIDIVFVMGWVSNLDYFWEDAHFARFSAAFGVFLLLDPVRQAGHGSFRSFGRRARSRGAHG